MKVEALMSKTISACSPADSLVTAARIMWERDVGFLPVVTSDGSVVGAITDRDIAMSALITGARLAEVPVAEVMATHVTLCTRDTEASAVEELMRMGRIRRLPVVNSAGTLEGVVSLSDLAHASSNPKRSQDARFDVAMTLSVICESSDHPQATPQKAKRHG